MRRLLDEHFQPAVAASLRTQGVDAVSSLAEGLTGVDDAALWAFAIQEERVMVTYSRNDFLELYQQFWFQGVQHPGLVIVLHTSIHQGDPGGQIRALAFLANTPSDLMNQIAHLTAAPS